MHEPHVALDAVNVMVDGLSTVEIALADADRNKVVVKLGLGKDSPEVTFDSSQGIDHPSSVKLLKLDDDSYPDLFVANTGGDNVLVFPGRANGQFGPEINGGLGFPAGSQPVSVDVTQPDDRPGTVQVSVANRGSDSVTITDAARVGDVWTTTLMGTIQTQSRPVTTLTRDIDGVPALFVCNSGSNTVTVYKGQPDGSFSPAPSLTFDVGLDPTGMLVGHFINHDGYDLVTLNSGENDLTVIGDAFGPRPTTQTISSGGTLPEAAFAVDPGQTGLLDLMVANGGDGHLALFRGVGGGLQLAGVITQPGLPNPSALAPSDSAGNGFDFFAASVGDDAALLLHFDLGVASTYLPGSTAGSAAITQADEQLFAQLTPVGDSSLDLIAVFWAGSPDSDALSGERGLREPTTITALYSPTEGQGELDRDSTTASPTDPPPAPSPILDPSRLDTSTVERVVLGDVLALGRPRASTAPSTPGMPRRGASTGRSTGSPGSTSTTTPRTPPGPSTRPSACSGPTVPRGTTRPGPRARASRPPGSVRPPRSTGSTRPRPASGSSPSR